MSKRKVPNDEILIDLYVNQKLTSTEISKMFGVSRAKLCIHLKRLGITKPISGTDSRHRKKDGEVLKSGYPVELLPEHPRASFIGYVFKHILEVEKHIGRTPLKTEPIHHIDLDRANYDLLNLYLCKSHSEHQQIHAQLDRLIGELIRNGTIEFAEGEYRLAAMPSR